MARVLDLLFTTEVICCLLVAGAVAFGISIVMAFIRDRDKLGRRLKKAERQLEKLRKQIARKRAKVKELTEEVKMLSPLEEKLREYYDLINVLRLAARG